MDEMRSGAERKVVRLATGADGPVAVALEAEALLRELLRRGYRAKVEDGGPERVALDVGVEGFDCLLVVFPERERFHVGGLLFAVVVGFADRPPSLAEVNAWNATATTGRAYLDDERPGVLLMEHFQPAVGPVAAATLDVTLRAWARALSDLRLAFSLY